MTFLNLIQSSNRLNNITEIPTENSTQTIIKKNAECHDPTCNNTTVSPLKTNNLHGFQIFWIFFCVVFILLIIPLLFNTFKKIRYKYENMKRKKKISIIYSGKSDLIILI